MKKYFPYYIHIIPILLLSLLALVYIETQLIPMYLLFTLTFLLSTAFSLKTILEYKSGFFYYLLNIMFVLGFWFKYSLQKILHTPYSEPTGNYFYSIENDKEVLTVIIIGIIGLILANFTSNKLSQFKFINKIKEHVPNLNTLNTSNIHYIAILVFTALLALINLKYNILLFAIKPAINLPFKGNAIYFLLLTRATIFLSLFYTFKEYNERNVIFGAVIATFASVGVLSRMMTLFYFSIILTNLISDFFNSNFKLFIRRIIYTFAIFLGFMFLTVYLSTSARYYYIIKNELSGIQSTKPQLKIENDIRLNNELNKQLDFNKKFNLFINLAIGRWIGIEGVMAVQSYQQKEIQLLKEAFNENSYNGNSFYTKIAQPNLIINQNSKSISTSVPGPIAFFYYSGSKLFVLGAIFIFCLFLSIPELITNMMYSKYKLIPIFVSSFIVFDFFQFGIAPLAFFRYFLFSVFSVFIFYYCNYFFSKVKSNQSISP